jgi:predicted methyltransferase
MPRLTDLAHAAVRAVVGPGEVVVDATAGNGRDTRFLSNLVGPAGRVFAFDVQPEALNLTAAALVGATNVTLRVGDHAELRSLVPAEHHGRIGGVMFNLGYLPGSAHAIITRTASTLEGIAAAFELLRSGGILTVVAYPGHPGGREEADSVSRLLQVFGAVEHLAEYAGPTPPRLFVVHKPPASG